MIFHYTSIDTLALILENRKIRFNRLDRVDDVRESQTACGIEFGKYFFVSCWTRSAEENIPLWTMYSQDMKGVRIGLPDMPFHMEPLEPPPSWNAKQVGIILSPISFGEMFCDTHCILPIFLRPEILAGDVKYVTDVSKIYKENVQLVRRPTGDYQLQLRNLPSLPRTKDICWSFQYEHRFALLITPTIPIPPGGFGEPNFIKRFANHLLSSFVNNVDHKITYYDLRLDNAAVDDIQVTLGPLADRADYLRVQRLLETYTASGAISESSLTGTIRKPKRA